MNRGGRRKIKGKGEARKTAKRRECRRRKGVWVKKKGRKNEER